ncbi:MAG: translocation/assembly module TamB, partial [Marinobacter sp.]|nr:translocation/assembly module TamB [Marinobacter sp.]
AEGSLQNGFRTRGQARLPGTAGPVKLLIDGLITTGAAENVRIELTTGGNSQTAPKSGQESAGASTRESTGESAGENAASTVVATGQVNWREGLNASADVRLRGFPWYTLVPDLGPPPVSLQTLDGTVAWQDANYQAELTADVDSPQGQAKLSATVNGDLQKVRLTEMSVATGAGSLSGNGSVTYAGPLAWQAALQLKDFNPGFWVPALEASLSGEVTTEGQLRDGGIPAMTAGWRLEGSWRSNPASLVGDLDTSSGSWQLSGLKLAVGENRLEGSGVWGDRLSADLKLAVPRPADLLPGLAGSLEASLTAGGTPENPTGELTANARELSWRDDLAVESASLDASLKPGLRLASRLEASDIEAFDQQLKDLAVEANGDQAQHRVVVSANHAETNLELGFEGGAGPDWQTWQGALTRGLIALPEQSQRWQLQSPATLTYNDSGELTFGKHCWQWQQSSVCAEDQRLL